MILFQILALAVIVPWAAIVAYKAMRRGRRRNLLLFALLALAGAAVMAPDITSRVARVLGIGRGADLVLYGTSLMTIACLFAILYVYRSLRIQLTELTRQLALAELEGQAARRAGPSTIDSSSTERSREGSVQT